MSVRDFSKAANLFLETISTFTSYELMDYTQFVTYTVYMGIIALDRRELLEKVIKGSEIMEILHACPNVKKYLNALYDCQYGDFFQLLAEVLKSPFLILECAFKFFLHSLFFRLSKF